MRLCKDTFINVTRYAVKFMKSLKSLKKKKGFNLFISRLLYCIWFPPIKSAIRRDTIYPGRDVTIRETFRCERSG